MHLSGSTRNLVLVGFMGSGKSSVGREIARRWGYRFLDTDSVIRQKHSKSILEIFESQGEPFFRDQEHLALCELQGSVDCVIATGGGIVLQPRNHPLLHALGIIVWLTATEEIIWERVSRNRKRPLLQTANPRGTISHLISLRNPLYESVADITVETSGLTHEEVANRVAAAVKLWAPGRRENGH
ncbi:MAG: shikimate kinase [Verrucomicrobia bacterium]|nr:shikimate kinase [Verrucomicrobiota bacterium]